MQNEINLTDDQIESIFDELGSCANLNEEFGAVNVIFTRDTLDSFAEASKNYAECNKPRYESAEGYKALCLDRAQVRKGDQRRDVVVVDFGTVRAVVL
jgi:hypothetical protein